MPTVAVVGLVVFAAMWWRLQATRRLSVPRASVAAAFAVYAAGIIANTIFPIYLDYPSSDEPWSPHVALIPFTDYEWADAASNVLVFVPLGLLIPLVMAKPSWRTVLPVAAGVSLSIEIAQVVAQRFFAGGHIADINDFLSNCAGGAIGLGLYMLAMRMPRLRGVVERFRWGRATEEPQ